MMALPQKENALEVRLCVSISQHFGNTGNGCCQSLFGFGSSRQCVGKVNDGDADILTLCLRCLYQQVFLCAVCFTHQTFHPIAVHSMVELLLGDRDEQAGQGYLAVSVGKRICLEYDAERPDRKTVALTVEKPIDGRLAAQSLSFGEGIPQLFFLL